MRKRSIAILAAALAVVTPAIADVGPSADAEAERAERLAHDEAIRAAAWDAYYMDIRRMLQARTDARSQALAMMPGPGPAGSNDANSRLTTLESNDPLVQWIVAVKTLVVHDDADAAVAIDRLKRIEPDNAAVWEFAFELALDRNDTAGAEFAFDRMAGSARSDEHYVDLVRTWMALFEAEPPPAILFDSPAEAAASPLTLAIGYSGAMRLPAYTPLITYCAAAATGSDRARRCVEIGHLMADHSTSLGGRNIGRTLLGRGEAANHLSDWIYMHIPAASGLDPKDLSRVQAYATDWREINDEQLIVERALRRAGVPASPPPGWQASPLITTLL